MVSSVRRPIRYSDDPGRQSVEHMKNASDLGRDAVSRMADSSGVNASMVSTTMGFAGTAELIPAVMRVVEGVKLAKTTKKTGDTAGQVFAGIGVARGIATTAKIGMDVSVGATKIVELTGKVAAVASPVLSQAAGGVTILNTLTKVVPLLMKLHQSRIIKAAIKKHGKAGLAMIFETKPHDLKRIAPKTYEKLRNGALFTDSLVTEALKEIRKTELWYGIGSSIFIAAIIATIASIVFTAGSSLVVASIIGLVVAVLATGFDFSLLVKALKNTNFLSKKDLAVKIIAIIIGVAVIAASIALAPTAAIAIASAVVGVVMLAAPIGSIIYLKMKEARLQEEEEKRKKEEKRIDKKITQTVNSVKEALQLKYRKCMQSIQKIGLKRVWSKGRI